MERRQRANLEHRLRKVIRDVEQGYLADEREREERERAWREQLERWEQQKAQERAEWEQAKKDAAVQAREKLRTDRFRAAYDGWSAAEAIREFCAALETHTSVGQQAGRNLARWAAWARHKADLLDPTVNLSVLADVEFHAEPTPRDLAPFMGEWSATEPIKAYRSEEIRQRHADIRAHENSWHHGMRGNPQAWRWRR